MVINVYEFEKYFFDRGDRWEETQYAGYIWDYVDSNNYNDGGLRGHRAGKSFFKSRLYSWVSLLWTPEYNGDGSFQLELMDTPENRRIRISDQLMYDEDSSGTIMVVTSRQMRDKKIVLNGVSMQCYILSKVRNVYGAAYRLNVQAVYTSELVYKVLASLFELSYLYDTRSTSYKIFPPLSGWDCVSADSVNKSYGGHITDYTFKAKQWDKDESAWEFIKEKILIPGDVGFGSLFIPEGKVNQNKLDLDTPYGKIIDTNVFEILDVASKSGGWQGFYLSKPGVNSNAMFSRKRGNVLDEIYTESESEYANDVRVYVGDNLEKLGYAFSVYPPGGSDGGYIPKIEVHPSSLHFLREDKTGPTTRRTTVIDASSEEPEGYDEISGTYSETAEEYIERIGSLVDKELSQTPLVDNWRFTIIDPDNKVNLGDIVKVESEYTGDILESRVTAITYKSQDGHATRTLTIGTPMPKRRR